MGDFRKKPRPHPVPPREGRERWEQAGQARVRGSGHRGTKRRKPRIASPAVTTRSPRIGTIGMLAGCPAAAGWPVTGGFEGVAPAAAELGSVVAAAGRLVAALP